MTPIGRLLPYVHDRVPRDRPHKVHDPQQNYDWLTGELQNRPWTTYMPHNPAGWRDSMTSAQWSSMTLEMQDSWRRGIEDSKAVRPELKIRVYLGLQHYGPTVIQGDPRDPGQRGRRFDQEPWAQPWNPQHRDELLDQTILPWLDIDGVEGVVFDVGSARPDLVRGWQKLLPDGVVVGLEALPMNGTIPDFYWAEKYGIHYHALAQFAGGDPFVRQVPAGVSAHCWLRNGKEQSDEWIQGIIDRGWIPCVDNTRDAQVQAIIGA